MAAQVEFTRAQGAAPILGPGSIEPTRDGLRVRGTGAASMWPTLAGVLVGLVGVIAAAIVLVALDVDIGHGTTKLPLLVGLVAGIGPGVAVHGALQRRVRGPAVDALIEWPGVRVLARMPGRVTLRLSSHEISGEVEVVAKDTASIAIVDAVLP